MTPAKRHKGRPGFMLRRKGIYIFSIMSGLLLIFALFSGSGSPEHTVTRIIDGDTVVIDSGEHVRLLGIDTPEKGQKYYDEARNYLKQRVLGKGVKLVYTNEEKDKYGRLLRYVFVSGHMINTELVEKGLAGAYIFIPDQYTDLLLSAEEKAKEAGLGIWSAGGVFCIGINWVQSNAAGNDNENLNGEFITLRNKCTYPASISGWRLQEGGGKTYKFKSLVIDAKNSVTLHTGSGKDNATDLYWGLERAVWNNAGDTVLVWDNESMLVLNYSY